nr:MAG TPA: NTP-PPase-like protein [Caudoviricetes sp.]
MRYRLYNADTLNRYAKGCHQRSVAKGFWDETHSVGHCLMLAFGELHEGIEADRLGK